MATCSYQTISRYENDRPRLSRSRNLDDIRAQFREATFKTRLQLKCIQMLRNRQTLTQLLMAEAKQDPDDDEPISPPLGPQDPSSRPDWCIDDVAQSQSPAPSVTSSIESSSSHLIEANFVPAFFFETPQSTPDGSSGRSTPVRSSKLSQAYKSKCNRISNSPRQRIAPKLEQVKADLLNLRQSLQPSLGRADVSTKLHFGWQTFADAFLSGNSETVNYAMDALTSLYSENLINTDTTFHIIQGGLIIHLCDILKFCHHSIIRVVVLLNSIVMSVPSVLPYLIDTMTQSRLLDDLAEHLQYGASDVVLPIVKFQHNAVELLLSNTIQFELPDILRITGVPDETMESYSAISTATKCVTPTLIVGIISRCLDVSMSREHNIINASLMVLADALKLAHISGDDQWVVQILCSFRDSHLDRQIAAITKQLNRVIKVSSESEHCSQGVGTDTLASGTKQICQQFLEFYQSHYNLLSATYANQMDNSQQAATHCYNTWS